MTTIGLYNSKIDKELQFPTEWNELTITELYHCLKVLSKDEPDYVGLFAFIFRQRLKPLTPDYARIMRDMDIEQVAMQSIELVDFVFTKNGLTKYPFQDGEHLNDFDGATVGMYEDAGIHYAKFRESQAHNDLQACIKAISGIDTLWQPNELAILQLWYVGCCTNMMNYFGEVFSGGGESTPSNILGFTDCIHRAVRNNNYKLEEQRAQPLKTFLYDLNLRLKDQAEQEKKHPK